MLELYLDGSSFRLCFDVFLLSLMRLTLSTMRRCFCCGGEKIEKEKLAICSINGLDSIPKSTSFK
jgi:hypothetical protein